MIQKLRPHLSLSDILERYRYRDFPDFLQSFKWVVQHLNGPEDYALVARDLFATLAANRRVHLARTVGVATPTAARRVTAPAAAVSAGRVRSAAAVTA